MNAKPFQCPTCDLSLSYQSMLRNTRLLVWEQAHGEDLAKFGAVPGSAGGEGADLEQFPWPYPAWPLQRVREVYNYVARRLAGSDGRVLDEWDELTARLARVVLEERAQAEFADHWNQMQKLKGQQGGMQLTSIASRR